MTIWKDVSTMRIAYVVIVCLAAWLPVSALEPGVSSGPRISGGLALGYDIGMPIQGHVLIQDLAEDLPLAFRFIISPSFFLDPGDPGEARRVFINANTNGVPEKSASRWAFGLDLLYPVNIFSLKHSFFYGGVHYSRFTSTFDFIGGNEFFDVHANQLGLGAGLESYFRMNQRIDLFFSLGGEYYFSATLEGHDAAYSPDGTVVNRRENFSYSDADRAINQPKFQPKMLLGVNYYF